MSILSSLHGTGNVLYSNLFISLSSPGQVFGIAEQTIIVTGANTGLGYESSHHLSRLGLGKLIMGVRRPRKGEEAKREILASTGRSDSSIEVWNVDMDDYNSIKAFAKRAAELSRVDGVLANAGIMTNEFKLSGDLESTLKINVVSTFLLYALMLPKMRESHQATGNPCRFVIPNSALHFLAPADELSTGDQSIFERLNDPAKISMAGRYALSKFLVIHAVRELAERSKNSGKGQVILNTPNPSFCKSGLARESQGSAAFRMFERMLARSTEEGSRALVHGLFAGEDTHGEYMSNQRIYA